MDEGFLTTPTLIIALHQKQSFESYSNGGYWVIYYNVISTLKAHAFSQSLGHGI